MSRDIVDTSTPSGRLVVATGIESEPTDQLACVEVQDADVAIGYEELDCTALEAEDVREAIRYAAEAVRAESPQLRS